MLWKTGFRKSRVFLLMLLLFLASVLMAAAANPGDSADLTVRWGPYGETRVVLVSGTGTAGAAPDIARAVLGVRTAGQDVQRVLRQANSAMEEVRAALRDTGISNDDVQTVAFNLSVEERRDEQGEARAPLYRMTHLVQVTVRRIRTVGDVLHSALDAGANTVQNVSFGLENEEELRSQARSAALEDAVANARALAQGLGVDLGPVRRVEHLSGQGPVAETSFQAVRGAGAGVPVSPGSITVTVQVQAAFDLLVPAN